MIKVLQLEEKRLILVQIMNSPAIYIRKSLISSEDEKEEFCGWKKGVKEIQTCNWVIASYR